MSATNEIQRYRNWHAPAVAFPLVLLFSLIQTGPARAFVSFAPRGPTRPRLLSSARAEADDGAGGDAATERKVTQNPKIYELHPNVRKSIIENKENRRKAKVKKRKAEPAADKKRRLLMQYKRSANASKRARFITRLEPEGGRAGLETLSPGDAAGEGQVISLTPFGAYVDVGAEIDGLLHVRDMSATSFVGHPREVFEPGQAVSGLVVKYSDAAGRRLALSAVPLVQPDEDAGDRIGLDEIDVHDELWGEIVKVTDFGAFVEIGAVVDGFLHFMDHPDFPVFQGQHPSTFMSTGERVRVWAADVDEGRVRVRLTAVKPSALPMLGRL